MVVVRVRSLAREEGRGLGQRVAPSGVWDPETLNLIQGTPLGSWVVWVCALLVFFPLLFLGKRKMCLGEDFMPRLSQRNSFRGDHLFLAHKFASL